jgi:hypothetical protein
VSEKSVAGNAGKNPRRNQSFPVGSLAVEELIVPSEQSIPSLLFPFFPAWLNFPPDNSSSKIIENLLALPL